MKITIYCIGKLKEDYWKSAIAEYSKRISAYAELDIVEFPDIAIPASASTAIEEDIKNKECAKILAKLKPNDYVIALDLNKKEYDSVAFAAHLDEAFARGGASINFVIGGSLGLSDDLKKRANESLSFGKMTFPHQLARVMLLEQLYRAFRINRGEPYHK